MREQWAKVAQWEIREGDVLDRLREMAEASVDAVVCDPPYGLEFMGKEWDRLGGARIRQPSERDREPGAAHNGSTSLVSRNLPDAYVAGARMQEWHEAWAREALRVLKPGGHLLAFGGTRTYHRLACAVEDAGFEIRDTIAWMYGSGFPKSLDVSKAINKAANAEHLAWEGWGTALKPAHEPVVVARKPLAGTVAANVLAHGTGALNIEAGRIDTGERWQGIGRPSASPNGYGPGDADGWHGSWTQRSGSHIAGRWPANVALDEDAAAMLDEQAGDRRSAGVYDKGARGVGEKQGAASIPIDGLTSTSYADTGGASRFFYCAKASRAERGDGNLHPTVKPVDLMCWLVRLVTPPDGLVLDPFAGSGTTGIAAMREGFSFVGIEREPEYAAIARERIRNDAPLLNQFAEVAA